MGLFGRRKAKAQEKAAETIEEIEAVDNSAADDPANDPKPFEHRPDEDDEPEAVIAEEDPADRETKGPWDVTEDAPEADRLDMGALRIPAVEGLSIRLEVDQDTERVVAINLSLEESTVQLQAFAAPRTDGIWDDIRTELVEHVSKSRGEPEQIRGEFGQEVLAKLPAPNPDGSIGVRHVRFVGVDGPRWFVRAVFSGPAALVEQEAGPLEQLIRDTVVVRGEAAMPPRELLELTVPAVDGDPEPEDDNNDDKDKMGPLERGPEIQQIG